MKRLFLILGACLAVVMSSMAATLPVDYDKDFDHIHYAPTGLSAGWAGNDVYISWNKTEDKFGSYVDGYRLYRAASKDSAFVLVNTSDETNNDDNQLTDESWELILETYYTDTALQLAAAGIYESVPFSYMVTAVVLIGAMADTVYSSDVTVFESAFSDPVEIAREVDFGCFIATAAFGSPLKHEVRTLCSFRDRFLLQNRIGSGYVNLYYRLSPPVADFIVDKPLLRSFLRLHLKPIIVLVKTLDPTKGPVNKESFPF